MRGWIVVGVVVAAACGGDDDGAGVRDAGGGVDGARADAGTADAAEARDGGALDDGGVRCVPPDTPADGWHVTTGGSAAGDGSMAAPWDLASVLSGDVTVEPGATVWVHGGTYAGTFRARLRGTTEAPIVVRAWPGDRATLDGAGSGEPVLAVDGEYAWYWGLEITNSDTENRVTTMTGSSPSDIVRGGGVNVVGASTDVRFINLAIHDTAQGIGFWTPAVDSEVYGSLVWANGWDAPDRAHGHAIYTQNMTGTKRIEENVLFHGFSYGVHAYTEGGAIQGFTFRGNVVFQTGTPTAGPREGGQDFLVGGGQPAARISVSENFGWSNDRGRTVFRLGYSADNEDIVMTGNYIAGETSFGAPWATVTMIDNTFIGAVSGTVDPAAHADNDYLDAPPAETAVFVRPNRYEDGRAHVIVYNWAGLAEVEVDLSAVLGPGAAYAIRNAQDFYGDPVASGVYGGGAVTVPLEGLGVAQPVGVPGGIEADEQTGSSFAVFVVQRTLCP